MSVDVRKRLAEIAAAIKAGARPEKFEKEIDRLTGMEEETQQDDEAAEIWERAYRAGRE